MSSAEVDETVTSRSPWGVGVDSTPHLVPVCSRIALKVEPLGPMIAPARSFVTDKVIVAVCIAPKPRATLFNLRPEPRCVTSALPKIAEHVPVLTETRGSRKILQKTVGQ